MSLTTTILRKDIRQYRILIGLLTGLLAVLLAVRLEVAGGVAPDPASNIGSGPILEGLLALLTVVIAGKLVSYLVFEDSPTRRERFLATRPVPARNLLLAKLTFLGAFVVAPFALAAALHLAFSGMPARVIALGTLQSILRTLALLGVGVPLMLLWESRRRLLAGIVAGGLGITAFALAIGLLQVRRSPLLSFRPDCFANPLVQVIAVAVAAIILTGLAAVHLRRPLGMAPRLAGLLVAGILAPLLAALMTSRHNASPEGPVPASRMARVGFNRQQADGKPLLGISLSPSLPTPADEDVSWSFASLRIDGRAVPLRPMSDPRLMPSHYVHSDYSRGIEAALHRHLGPGWSLVMSHYGRDLGPASASAFERRTPLPSGRAPIDAVFRGNRFSWHAVAELPLIPGSSVRAGDDTWTFHRSASDSSRDLLRFSLSHRGPALWLAPGGQLPRFDRQLHRFALLDPGSRQICLLNDRHPVRRELGAGTACPRRGLLLDMEGGREAIQFASAGVTRLRLLILRPRHEGVRFCRWSAPEPVTLPDSDSFSSRGLANEPSNLRVDAITRWIESNPGPDPEAPSADVARYLVSILEQSNRCAGSGDWQPVVRTLAAYVPNHLELFLRALDSLQMDQHRSRSLLYDALGTGIRHSQLPNLVRHLGARPTLVCLARRHDWTAEIAPDLARLIRGGKHDQVLLNAATSLPDSAGITADEWLAIFRLDPRPRTYAILREIPGLDAALDSEIDQRFTGSIPLLMDNGVEPLLELALARGHPEAPARLHQAVRFSTLLSDYNHHSFLHTITNHIDLSTHQGNHNDADTVVPWFLALDPAGFTYDPATRLYTVREP